MDIVVEIARIEGIARQRRVPIAMLCKSAGVAASNWARWKSRRVSPTFSKWQKVVELAGRLERSGTIDEILSAASNPCDGDSAGHAAGSSQHPILETEQSPTTSRVVGDRIVTSSPSGG